MAAGHRPQALRAQTLVVVGVVGVVVVGRSPETRQTTIRANDGRYLILIEFNCALWNSNDFLETRKGPPKGFKSTLSPVAVGVYVSACLPACCYETMQMAARAASPKAEKKKNGNKWKLMSRA